MQLKAICKGTHRLSHAAKEVHRPPSPQSKRFRTLILTYYTQYSIQARQALVLTSSLPAF